MEEPCSPQKTQRQQHSGRGSWVSSHLPSTSHPGQLQKRIGSSSTISSWFLSTSCTSSSSFPCQTGDGYEYYYYCYCHLVPQRIATYAEGMFILLILETVLLGAVSLGRVSRKIGPWGGARQRDSKNTDESDFLELCHLTQGKTGPLPEAKPWREVTAWIKGPWVMAHGDYSAWGKAWKKLYGATTLWVHHLQG